MRVAYKCIPLGLALAALIAGGEEPADKEAKFIGARGRYWAFQKVVRPPTPEMQDSWVRTPIDGFIQQALVAKKLTPSAPLERIKLIRRVTFDLIGLPPTPAEVDAFLADKSPDAYEKVVDRLMASPHYGERWALKWLDVVRYADTNGFELDADRTHSWRYRDYVIDSFNQDKPYDRFIQEQIAGDEMFPGDKTALIATGYLRAGQEHLVGGNIDPEMSREEVLTEIATSVGQTYLGLTVNCARCHNHKFDPILQADYYRLQAIFGGASGKEVEIATLAEKAAWEAADKAYKERLKPVTDALENLAKPYHDRIVADRLKTLDPKLRAAYDIPKEKRTAEQKVLAENAKDQLEPAWDVVAGAMTPEDKETRAKLRARLHEIEATEPDPLPMAYAYTNNKEAAPQAYVLRMGNPQNKLDPVDPAVPRVLKASYEIPKASIGRRTALAMWLTSGQNPLTARVMVNRIWQFRMGTGIVRTPNDFGVMGDRPSNQPLLDWLAAEFVANGWSVRKIDRLIVTSNVYLQATTPDREKQAVDPDNRLYWRMNRKRMEGETLRDEILSVTGSLNPSLGGRPVRIPIEPEVYDLIFTEHERDGLWPVSPDKNVRNRRSIYLYNKRSVRLPLLNAFDQPDAITSCPVRPVSTHALQALSMFNSDFMQEQAAAFAGRLEQECKKGDRRCEVNQAWRLTLSRAPNQAEQKLAKKFFSDGGSLSDMCLALLNRNEFVYVP
ncbi:MAG: DUF1549 and DUF1553 domain-containing protein [Bryobacteraceae bacterium]